jgi:hypothetical protein
MDFLPDFISRQMSVLPFYVEYVHHAVSSARSTPIHLREVSRHLRQFPDENAKLM